MSASIGNSSASILYKMINKDAPPNPLIQTHQNYSMRRTMSADMSSPKWLQHNGSSSSMKRVQSSEQLHALGEANSENQIVDSTNEEKNEAFENIWTSVQADKRSWSSILSQHQNSSRSGSGYLPPPYVHPSVRRSVTSLSEKSLEICTESLGSETGSNRFSYPPSDPEDMDSDTDTDTSKKNNYVDQVNEYQTAVANYYPPSKRVPPSPRSFPPPLPSLGGHRDGSNLHIMRSHRHDGRLVIEAVSVPSNNCFRVHRHGGRLLLTLSDDSNDEDEHARVIIEENQGIEENVEKEINDEEKQVHPSSSSSSALIMSKMIIGITSMRTKTNSMWRHNINATGVARLLPAVRPTSTATTANAYEYYWRRTAAVAHVLKPLAGQTIPTTNVGGAQQVEKGSNKNKLGFGLGLGLGLGLGGEAKQEEVVVVKAARGGGAKGEREKEIEYLVPLLRGCKEPRRSLLCCEPYCIATS